MRQLKRFGWLLATGVLLLFSCVKEIEPPTEPLNLDPHHISVEQAVRTMESTILELYGGTRAPREYTIETLKGSDLQKTSARIGTRTMNDTPLPEDVLYVANFADNGGFAVLAADDRLPEVFAITEEGSFSFDRILHGSGELSAAELYTVQVINSNLGLFNLPPPHDPTVPPGCSLYIDGDGQRVIIPEKFHQMQMPLLGAMRWGQDIPFNRLCFAPDGRKALVGCTALAVSMILAAHEYPDLSYFTDENTNWTLIKNRGYTWEDSEYNDLLPANEATRIAVGDLLYKIGTEMGVKYGSVNLGQPGPLPSGLDSIEQAIRYFEVLGYETEFHFDEERSWTFSFQEVVDAIDEGLPVYVETDLSAHAWVIDGVYFIEENVYVLPFHSARLYFHCNFGMYGHANGYYLAPRRLYYEGNIYYQNFFLQLGPDLIYPGIDQYDTDQELMNYNFQLVIPKPIR